MAARLEVSLLCKKFCGSQLAPLLLQEFECGVTSGNGDMEKQEWSFTLYDFDGRGKVTKEVSFVSLFVSFRVVILDKLEI